MIIAKEKKNENISEYLLYMYQIEDIIRSKQFDLTTIREEIIDQFDQPESIKDEMESWYAGLIQQMKEENKEKTGHLSFLEKITSDLDELHSQLLKNPDELQYIDIYNWAKPNIQALREKSNSYGGDIQICLNGLYSFLLLRLKKEELTIETTEAISTFSNLMALLSKKYKEQHH